MLFTTLRRIIVEYEDRFGPFQFQLATLPISHSGLGVYNPADLSRIAYYVASLYLTKPLQDQILHLADGASFHPEYEVALTSYLAYTTPPTNNA